jgi:hypothetical protein
MGLDTSEREVRWLNELIAHERADTPEQATTSDTSDHPDNKGEADHG